MDHRAVWITGIGPATPLGFDFESIAQRLLAGQSAARLVVDQNVDNEFRAASCVVDQVLTPGDWLEADFGRLPRLDQLALWACSAALEDSGWARATDGMRIGLVLGCGAEWLKHWESSVLAGETCLYEGSESNSLVQRTQARLGIAGPAVTVSAACASANYAIAMARRWIRQGMVDICLAGGVETISDIGRAAFHNLRALSRRTDHPACASRPFDRDRDGFVISEGSVMIVL